jgi:hypothetical protein
MNIKAECRNPKCGEYEKPKSVLVEQLLGHGAANDRVKCLVCGELMTTTETANTTYAGRNNRRRSGGGRGPSRR